MTQIQVRKVTNQLREAVDEGILTYEQIAEAALKYMSEDDVADMAAKNELLLGLDEDEDEDEMLYHAVGDPGTEDETSLYESTVYSEVLEWTRNYVRTGFGGWNVIEVGCYGFDDEWEADTRFENGTTHEELYSDLD